MRNICFVLNKYVNRYEPNMLVFVQQLAWKMADLGKKVTIIAPSAINLNFKYIKLPYHSVEKTPVGNTIDIYRPKTIGFGQSRLIFGKSPIRLTTYFMEKSALRTIRKLRNNPDVLYGHFLAPSGIVVARLGKRLSIPVVFALGESHDTIGQFGAQKAKKELDNVVGVISVSTQLKEWAVRAGVIPEDRIEVFPNSVDSNRFYKRDKNQSRDYFGIHTDNILVAFVGAFDNRKGILRVCEAVKQVDDVELICAGKGIQQPCGEKCIFAEAIKPEEVPIFDSCADIFVLPTLNEGCSNAIVEALSCELPVISSNLPFNNDILDDSYSIRVNPENIEEIANAIRLLANNETLRQQMSKAAGEKAKELTLEIRAKNIVNFIEEKCKEHRYES